MHLLLEPSAVPANLTFIATTTSLTFTWDEVPCGNRGGPNTYKYTLDTSSPVETAATSVTISDLIPCSSYQFSVLASTSAGDGPVTNIAAATDDESKLNHYPVSSSRPTSFVFFDKIQSRIKILTVLCSSV